MKSPEENSTNLKLLILGVHIKYSYSFIDKKIACYLIYDGKEIKRPSLGDLKLTLKLEFDIDF